MAEVQEESILRRVCRLEHELEQLKRDLLHSLSTHPTAHSARKPSFFGSVQGGDVTEEMIEEAKKKLFRNLKDL